MAILVKQTRLGGTWFIIDNTVYSFNNLGMFVDMRKVNSNIPLGTFNKSEIYSYLVNIPSTEQGLRIGTINNEPYREFVKYTDANNFVKLKLPGLDSVQGKQIIEATLKIKPVVIKTKGYIQYLYPKTIV